MATVKEREWTTAEGEVKRAWIVRYRDKHKTPNKKTGELEFGRHIETFARKKDAEDRRIEIEGAVRKGTHVARSRSITVAEAGRLWLEGCDGLERATIDSYRQHVDLHIVPFLGHCKLSDLRTGTVRDFQADLRKAGRSDAMIKRLTVTLGTILADAQERNFVGTNVVRDLRRGRKGTARHEQRDRRQLELGVDIPTRAEIGTLLGSLRDDRWRPLLIVAIFCGLRISEIRGLRWADVDLANAKLHVRQRADKYSSIGSPKSAKGRRTIPLPGFVVTTLKDWRKKCPKSALDLVFPSENGRPQQYPNVRRRGLIPCMFRAGLTKPLLDDAGQPVLDKQGKPVLEAKYSLHSLRHFFASWCLSRRPTGLGMTLLDVRDLMGHSTIALTADRYSHLLPRSDDLAELDTAADALRGASPAPPQARRASVRRAGAHRSRKAPVARNGVAQRP